MELLETLTAYVIPAPPAFVLFETTNVVVTNAVGTNVVGFAVGMVEDDFCRAPLFNNTNPPATIMTISMIAPRAIKILFMRTHRYMVRGKIY